MKFTELNAAFTAKVQEYLNNGYTFNLNTMAGHQGEIAKVDLTNGTEIIRIVMDKEPTERIGCNKIVLLVGRNTDRLFSTGCDNQTVWTAHLDVIERKEWYRVAEDWFIDYDEEAVKKLDNIRYQRWTAADKRRTGDITNEGAKKIIARYIKRTTGKTRVKLDSISRINKQYYDNRTHYLFSYRGETYCIC